MSFVLFDGASSRLEIRIGQPHLPRRGTFSISCSSFRVDPLRGFRIRGCRPHGFAPHPSAPPSFKRRGAIGQCSSGCSSSEIDIMKDSADLPESGLISVSEFISRTILKRPDSQAMGNMEWLFLLIFSEGCDGVLSRQFCLHDFMPPYL